MISLGLLSVFSIRIHIKLAEFAVADDACLHGRRGDESEGLQPLVVLSPKHEKPPERSGLPVASLLTTGIMNCWGRVGLLMSAHAMSHAQQQTSSPLLLSLKHFGARTSVINLLTVVGGSSLKSSSARGSPGGVRRVCRRNLGLNELCLCVELGAESPESSGDGIVVGYEQR